MHKLLSTLSVNGAAHAAASERQSQVLAKELLGAKLSLQDVSELAQHVVAVPWSSSEHRDVVLKAASSCAAQGPSSVSTSQSRRPMQDFCAIVDYYSEEQWAVLLSQASSAQKAGVLLQQAHALGLRCAGEQTMQRLTTLYLLVTEGAEQAKVLPQASKLAVLAHLKNSSKRLGALLALCICCRCLRAHRSWRKRIQICIALCSPLHPQLG